MAVCKWCHAFDVASEKINRDFGKAARHAQWREEARFVSVHEGRHALPSNIWPRDERLKQIGRLMPHSYVSLVRCLGSVQRQCVEDEDEARELEEGAQKDFLDPNVHFCVPMYVE